MSAPIRIVIADDHPVIRQALTAICAHERDLDVVAVCSTGKECLTAVRSYHPDVIVLDLSMPGGNGLEVLAMLREEPAAPRVVIWTAGFERKEVIQAVRLGARSIVLKQSAPEELIKAIRNVHRNEDRADTAAIERSLDMLAEGETSAPKQTQLSGREAEVARLVCQGLSNKEIATLLQIGTSTVKTHIEHVYEKFGITNRVELANVAQREGLF
jgi:DNA-binding NarL/FixJ family response regulator